MRLFELLTEQENKSAVFTFGRMNPPTKGHERLIRKINQVSTSLHADPFVFVSQSHDKKRNPLDYESKVNFLKQFFPHSNIVKDRQIVTLFDVLRFLNKANYKKIYMVAGDDRVDEFRTMIFPYILSLNPNVNPDDALDFNHFEVISAGQRDPDMSGISGMSASKARELAKDGKMQDFMKFAAPSSNNELLKKQLFMAVRRGMK